MPAQPTIHQLAKTETDVAVLQVQYQNLTEKVDDLKSDLKDIRDCMDSNNQDTQELIKGFQADNVKAHNEMSNKISAIEKWKWMLMGAGVLAGALGLPVLEKLLGM